VNFLYGKALGTLPSVDVGGGVGGTGAGGGLDGAAGEQGKANVICVNA
jgi:hypothetical protein